MKKSILVMVVLSMLAVLAACNQEPAGAPSQGMKIAVVDSNRVMMESVSGQSAMEYLRGLSTQLQGELQAMQQSMDQNQTEEESKAFQEKFAASQARMGDEQNRIVAVLNDAYEGLLEKYRKQEGISLILSSETAISYSEDVDITDEIITEMNALDIDLETEMAAEPDTADGMEQSQ